MRSAPSQQRLPLWQDPPHEGCQIVLRQELFGAQQKGKGAFLWVFIELFEEKEFFFKLFSSFYFLVL